MEPGVEPVRVAQARKVTPGSDICLLDRVARELRVPEDEAGDGVQPRDGRDDERVERVMIAPARSLDEIPLVHGRPRDASIRPRSRVLASTSPTLFPAPAGNRQAGASRSAVTGAPASNSAANR